MKKAVIAITEGGIKLAYKIKEKTRCDIYTLDKYADEQNTLPMKASLKEFMEYAFESYKEIIMIMSCGIAVRCIAGCIESKQKDPAIVVTDELGSNVISLLSGHLGGANALAKEIAAVIGGSAVITTASDNLGIEAVDTMAQRLGLIIDDIEAAKKVTACMVNGKKTGVLYYKYNCHWSDKLTKVQSLEDIEKYKIDALIYIGNEIIDRLDKLKLPVAKLIPQNLIVGIGCKRNISFEHLDYSIKELFKKYSLNIKAVKGLATIELKKHEECIIRLSNTYNIPISVVEIEEIKAVEALFECSELVRSVTGAGCICQPAAYLASDKGSCIVPKTCLDGITISVYETNRGGK